MADLNRAFCTRIETMKRLFAMSALLLIATAVAAQSTGDREVLTQARRAYYNLRSQGVSTFQCNITPDWKLLLADQQRQNPEAADTAIKTLSQLRFTASMGADGTVTLTHNELTGQSPEMNQALAQIYGGMQQMTSGFFDTWKLFVVNTPFPETSSEFQLQSVGAFDTLRYRENKADVTTTFSSADYAISNLIVTTSEFDSSIQPIFTKSANGLLLTGYTASYKSGKPEEATQLNVSIDYQSVSGVLMLSNLKLSGTYGGTPFAVALSFQGCQVAK
jgi:hypothetical protein